MTLLIVLSIDFVLTFFIWSKVFGVRIWLLCLHPSCWTGKWSSRNGARLSKYWPITELKKIDVRRERVTFLFTISLVVHHRLDLIFLDTNERDNILLLLKALDSRSWKADRFCCLRLDQAECVPRLYHVLQTCDPRPPSFSAQTVALLHPRRGSEHQKFQVTTLATAAQFSIAEVIAFLFFLFLPFCFICHRFGLNFRFGFRYPIQPMN